MKISISIIALLLSSTETQALSIKNLESIRNKDDGEKAEKQEEKKTGLDRFLQEKKDHEEEIAKQKEEDRLKLEVAKKDKSRWTGTWEAHFNGTYRENVPEQKEEEKKKEEGKENEDGENPREGGEKPKEQGVKTKEGEVKADAKTDTKTPKAATLIQLQNEWDPTPPTPVLTDHNGCTQRYISPKPIGVLGGFELEQEPECPKKVKREGAEKTKEQGVNTQLPDAKVDVKAPKAADAKVDSKAPIAAKLIQLENEWDPTPPTPVLTDHNGCTQKYISPKPINVLGDFEMEQDSVCLKA